MERTDFVSGFVLALASQNLKKKGKKKTIFRNIFCMNDLMLTIFGKIQGKSGKKPFFQK